MSFHGFSVPAVSLLALCLGVSPLRIFAEDAENHGVARLSVVLGEVSVRRADSGDYVAAAVNAPVVANDSVATGPGGRAELQFDSANVLRLGHDAEVRFTDLQYNRLGMQIARGTVTYSALRDSGAQVEISTPTVSVRPVNRGSVRVSVLDNGQTEITVRSGRAEIFTPRGAEELPTGQTMIARGSVADPEFQIVSAIPRDEWDSWNESRDRALEAARSYQYVSRDISGAEDLDRYGQWVSDPGYGQVWRPQVAAGWAPYRDGRWVWTDYYGWTWLGDEPWAWAPYHYGRWFYGNAGWCWYPGSIYSHDYWRPALVSFFGFGRGGSRFGFGFGNVGWVPLAPYEAYRPWYGRGFRGGFGGRNFTVVNNTNIFGTFRNARYGVTGIDARNFGGGRFGRNFAVSGGQINQAGLVRGNLPFQPVRQSFRFSDRQASFVPRGNSFSRSFSSRQSFAQPPRSGAQSEWNRFGQSAPVNRDSGWNRFGVARGGVGASVAPSRSGSGNWQSFAGRQSAPVNRDSGWNRFGGERGGMGGAGTTSRPGAGNWQGFAGRQSAPMNRDSGWNRFSGARGALGAAAAPSRSGAGNWQGFAGRQSAPVNRDSGSNRFGGMREGMPMPTAPRQSFENRSAGASMPNSYSAPRGNFNGGSGFGGRSAQAAAPAFRSAPSYSGRSFNNSAPRTYGSAGSGFQGGGGRYQGGGGGFRGSSGSDGRGHHRR